MKSSRGIAALVTCLSVMSASASAEDTGQRPLTAAIDQSIHRLVTTAGVPRGPAASAHGQRDSRDWDDVIALPRGKEIHIRADTGIDGRRSLVFADDAELVVLNLSHPALSRSVRKRLQEISVDQPAALLSARQRTIVTDRTISIGAGVISESGLALAPLDEVLQTIPRSAVQEIRIGRTGGSKVGAAIGATAGLVAGLLTAPYWMMKQCGRSCGDEGFMVGVSLVGLPVAGALVGSLPRKEEVVVYRSMRRSDH